ncbi:hypothetical protein LZ30DRAFT_724188 [Colletotrichum cereale]|nr:hypothetical protein LZ30DRAFT_724188 [Colletotrichum cereale]
MDRHISPGMRTLTSLGSTHARACAELLCRAYDVIEHIWNVVPSSSGETDWNDLQHCFWDLPMKVSETQLSLEQELSHMGLTDQARALRHVLNWSSMLYFTGEAGVAEGRLRIDPIFARLDEAVDKHWPLQESVLRARATHFWAMQGLLFSARLHDLLQHSTDVCSVLKTIGSRSGTTRFRSETRRAQDVVRH